jgi:TetR/AcrR family transcriptional repressor of nem operon
MTKSGQSTKERILDATQELVFRHGFAATTIDNLLERTGLTKGAFFYHFKNKAELGEALVRRYAARDRAMLEEAMQRAEKLSDDPLGQVLIFVGLLMESLENLTAPPQGCLFAAYLYQPLEFVPGIAKVAEETLLEWRNRLVAKFDAIGQPGAGASPVDFTGLADQLLAVMEGSFVLAKGLDDAQLPLRQLDHYRRYLQLLFKAQAQS